MNHSTADTTVARTELEASASLTTRTQTGWWARLKTQPPALNLALNLALKGGGAHGAFTRGQGCLPSGSGWSPGRLGHVG